jgi:hypothetical protein
MWRRSKTSRLLLDLLDVTADALAATWDQRAEVSGEDKFQAGDDFKPTIQ